VQGDLIFEFDRFVAFLGIVPSERLDPRACLVERAAPEQREYRSGPVGLFDLLVRCGVRYACQMRDRPLILSVIIEKIGNVARFRSAGKDLGGTRIVKGICVIGSFV
jgi:hypothetical protein